MGVIDPREHFDALRAALRAAEQSDPSLRIKTVYSAVNGLPASMPLGYAHPVIEPGDHDAYATLDGRVKRI